MTEGEMASDMTERERIGAYDALIAKIYAAVGVEDHGIWANVLAGIGRFLNSRTTVLEFATPKRHGRSLFLAGGDHSDAGAIDEWENRDPDEILAYTLGSGQVMVCNDYHSRSLSSGFSALLKKYSVARSISCAMGKSEDRYFLLHAARSSEEPPYKAQDEELIRMATAHLAQAVRLHTAMVGARSVSAVARDIVSGFGIGLVLMDGVASVHPLNTHGARVLESGLFSTMDGKVVATDQGAQRQLQALVQQALDVAVGDAPCHIGAMRVPDPMGGPDCAVGVKSLSVETAPFRLERRSALLYFDGGAGALPGAQAALRTIFSLTPMEARVAEKILHGVELVLVAPELGIGDSTLRFHVKSIYEKLNVRTKGAMIATLARYRPFLGEVTLGSSSG